MRKRRVRRRAVGVWVPILFEAKANARGSLDFVYDQFANARRLPFLTIVDDVTKECFAAIRTPRSRTTRCAGTHGSRSTPRQAGFDRLRQRHRVHLECHPGLVAGNSIEWHFIAP